MSKVYIIREWPIVGSQYANPINIGIISSKKVAEKWSDSDENLTDVNRSYMEFELDDPELLNRIAKEGKNEINS